MFGGAVHALFFSSIFSLEFFGLDLCRVKNIPTKYIHIPTTREKHVCGKEHAYNLLMTLKIVKH